MHNTIFIGVLDRTTNEYYVAACKPPVLIGRGDDLGNQILTDPKYSTVSRLHGVIEQASYGFTYTDRSKRGSRVGGLLLRGSRSALGNGVEIQIENYTLSIVEASPLIVVHTDPALLELNRALLLPGRGLGIKRGGTGLTLADLNRWTEWGDVMLAHLEMAGEGASLVLERPELQASSKINKAPLQSTKVAFRGGDVIEIDRQRFEIHEPGANQLVCSNAACNLINPFQHEANCRWCGWHLGSTAPVSRYVEGLG
jgi:hypothetical protein